VFAGVLRRCVESELGVEGKRLGRYVIESKLGEGGMGKVYRALDERLGKTVALKVLSDEKSFEGDSRKRFRQEALAAAILNHAAVATVFDYDEADGIPYIVYEYAEGRTLDRLIAEGTLTELQIVDISIQITKGLEHAHDRGIIHRDIKPQNIMVSRAGDVKILDFGLAKRTRLGIRTPDGKTSDTQGTLTVTGTIVGTAQYMSPEQLASDTLDGRTDIFSFGVVMYEMATGRNPFQGQNFASIVGKIMSSEMPAFTGQPLKVSKELQDIILRCLQKKRDERYSGTRLVLQDLESVRTGLVTPNPQSVPSLPLPTAVIPRSLARTSLIMLQLMYLALYGFALYYHLGVLGGLIPRLLMLPGVNSLLAYASPVAWASVLLVTACAGVTVRLYLLASVGFDDPETGHQFRRIFPFLFLLDELWALTPLLLLDRWPPGVALMGMAILAYLPMSQRTLMKSAYAWRRADSAAFKTGTSH
jgi:predicted Ser/Thr protein kinase